MDQTNTPIEVTAKAATSPGKLMKTARLVTEAGLDRKLLESLKVKQVGTYRIEVRAWELAKDTKIDIGDNKESQARSKPQKKN